MRDGFFWGDEFDDFVIVAGVLQNVEELG